jgi:hypothetical protein
LAEFPETPEIFRVIVCGAQPIVLPGTPTEIAGGCPQLFEIENRKIKKKEILKCCFIFRTFNPKKNRF